MVDDGTAYGARPGRRGRRRSSARSWSPRDKTQEKQTNFDATVTKVKNAGADAVFYGGYTNEAAPFLKQLRAAGMHGQVRRR